MHLNNQNHKRKKMHEYTTQSTASIWRKEDEEKKTREMLRRRKDAGCWRERGSDRRAGGPVLAMGGRMRERDSCET